MRLVARVALLVFAALGGAQACHRGEASIPPAPGTLKVEMGKQTRLDPEAALRCFVHGQFVGMQTPAECAQKNGVAPGALDVGLDQSGALAAGGGDTPLQPLSNAISNETSSSDETATASGSATGGDDDRDDQSGDDGSNVSPSGECMRYAASGWVGAGRGVSLDACVHTLFEGRCAAPGQTVFGRWGSQTLRLTPGRVAMSSDNRSFHPLAAQDLGDCSIPPL